MILGDRQKSGGYKIELFIVIWILIRKLIQRFPACTPDCASQSNMRWTNGKKTCT